MAHAAKPWDLFMFVEIGVDRIHHAFWKYMDPDHHLYEPGNPYENTILDYYKHLDRKIGELLSSAGEDTVVLVVSDHGAKRMKGAFCVNEWLIEQGDLVVKETAGARCQHRRPRHRLGKDQSLGLGRLLRPDLPQRRGPGAARASSSPRTTRRRGRT